MPTPALFWSCLHQWSASLWRLAVFIYGPIKNHTSVGDEFGLKVLFQCKHYVCVMNVNSREEFRIKSAAPSAGRTGKGQETK